MRRTVIASLVVLVGCTTGGASTRTAVDVAAVRAAIDSLDVNAQRLANGGFGDSLATQYFAPEAVAMLPNASAVTGTDAIGAAFKAQPGTVMRLHWRIRSIRAADSLAVTRGTYIMNVYAVSDTTKPMVADHGNYVTTFERTAIGWRAVYDIASSDVPIPSAAARKPSKR